MIASDIAFEEIKPNEDSGERRFGLKDRGAISSRIATAQRWHE
jgi:hypothetical protein